MKKKLKFILILFYYFYIFFKNVANKICYILKNDSNATFDSSLGLSMSGCGFLGSYHFGAVICIQKNSSVILLLLIVYFQLKTF